MRRFIVALAVVAAGLLAATTALGHPERATTFPNLHRGAVPEYRTTGPYVSVCASDSQQRVNRIFAGDPTALANARKYLDGCRYHSIQDAVNVAQSGYRIEILPGVYKEPKSRAVPVGAYHEPPCGNHYVVTEGFTDAPPPVGPRSNDPPVRPDRNYQVKCPNSKNLIEVVGDPRPEATPDNPSKPKCLQKCNLQIEGLGKQPTDTVIVGDRKKLDVLRIDRADGVYIRNLTVEQSAFNGIDLVEVNGYRISHVVARYNQDYGVLSFTAVHGLFDSDEAYGNGDSGLYPGSSQKGCDPGPDGTCDEGDIGNRKGCDSYTNEIRDSYSHGNTLGYSGTAGNSTYVHDNRFVDNASGLSTDSFAAGHPGMPQECVKWEHNEIGSNNFNPFTAENQQYCTDTPFAARKRTVVCPQFQVPVGTGIVLGGANRNLIRRNHIFGNWRTGILLLYVPAALRGENDPAKQFDTSNGNKVIENKMGQNPSGKSRPNGRDVLWDSQGAGNCWHGNTASAGSVNIPPVLPDCPGSPIQLPVNAAVSATQIPCTAWDPKNLHIPPGCDWFTTPAKP